MPGQADKLLKPGSKFGDYTVIRLLGAGGMGAVYLIRGDQSGEEFAVKILDPEVEKSDVEYKRRFIFEAELAMSIRHPNLIGVYDVGRDPDTGFAYIIMEYVPGGTVRDRISKWGALSIEESSDIVCRVAQGLVAVNAHHVVHRDIKPDNIMFTADGVTPKLADLGIARRKTAGTQSTALTQSGYLIGSPAYMAPEQMLDSHNADIRADIHALGVSFWEMLAGRRPFETDDAMELVARAMKGEPIPDIRRFRSDVPPALAQFIAKMCHPDVAQRFQTPQAVVDELQALRLRGFALPHSNRMEKATTLRKKHQTAICVGATAIVVGVLLVATAVVSLVKMVRPPQAVKRVVVVQEQPPASEVVSVTEEKASVQSVEMAVDESLPTESGENGTGVEEQEVDSVVAAVQSTKSTPAKPSTNQTQRATVKPVARVFSEVWAVELRKYVICCARAAKTGEEARREAVAQVVNEARALDPDLRIYSLEGKPCIAGYPILTPEKRLVLRAGKIFLMLEMLRAECPKLMSLYAEQKAKATAPLKRSRTLSLADTVRLLEQAVGHELGTFFESYGIVVDSSKSIFAQP